ncbi:hypothetical protein LOZ80_09945 [Paenibacillus sp. HWE-109]|uniref:hypothetical protein n=1 Tax=Paenibacillus sp. HWE-109 TaxID=1306526 RepID=UPI001EDEFBD7|nr:hypothetical protein [Paenibacillus sp. HWE-109]UKS29230.1 hypothetical protein LOZ80_09945 [Paenibacillus sp. HWE-109]
MLHPFMGIEDWDRVGLSVEESARRLQRIAYMDRGLMHMEAGFMIATPEYEVKGALSRMVWQDASHHDELRSRCKQLRMSVVAFDKCQDVALKELLDRSLEAESTLIRLKVLFEVIKPAQIAAIRSYMSLAQPLVDEPTLSLFKRQLPEREDQVAWGIAAIAELSQAAKEDELEYAVKWKGYTEALLRAAGGIEGTDKREETAEALILKTRPFEVPRQSTRDSRFVSAIKKHKDQHFADSDQGRLEQMMFTRFFEMSPAEGVAYVHFTTVGKPWAFYYDTARHLWDEVRHAWFGEAALRKNGYDIYEVPNWTGWYDMTAQLFEKDEAYTHLTIAIEKAAMKYPPGKREEWEFCRDIAKDPLMTTFQDFDWADEVVHASFGQKWIIDEVHHGDNRAAKEAAAATVTKRLAYMRNYEDDAPPKANRFAGGY